MIVPSLVLTMALSTFYFALIAHDGSRGATLYTLPYRTLRWLGKGGKFWGSIPDKP